MNGRSLGTVTAVVVTAAVALVAQFEGTRYVAYPDPATRGAPWTICKGHTRNVKEGDTATRKQCDDWLREDLDEANDAINRCISVPLNDNQRAALMSAVMNAGPSLVCGSSLQRKANAGDLMSMCGELSRWIYADGRVLPGLVRRRSEERALCERKP